MTDSKDHFKKLKKSTRVKIDIVTEYFSIWANIMQNASICRNKILTYMDLFSGPGIYDDGNPSTPIRILSYVSKNIYLLENLKTEFYEGENKYFLKLQKNIQSHEAYNKLKFEPVINPKVITPEIADELNLCDCTFCFIDPFGYKDLHLDLFHNVTKNWGCDCVFYFNTRGIVRNFDNETQNKYWTNIFGNEGFKRIKERHEHEKNTRFEKIIIDELQNTLENEGVKFFIPFAIEFEEKEMISHHLVFITKHELGFRKMKEIMYKHSLKDGDIPQYISKNINYVQLGFSFDMNIGALQDLLLKDFSGQEISVAKIYEKCNKWGYLYVDKNIKDALIKLESRNLINVDKPIDKRMRKDQITLGEARIVTFLN